MSVEFKTLTEVVKPGKRYRHFKGGIYEIRGLGTHTETGESMVVYSDKNDKVWIRPEKMFRETVDTPAGKVKRFTLMSE